MKKLFITTCSALIALYATNSANAKSIADSTLHLTYIGATGYLVESSTKKVLIEPTCGDAAKNFGYPFANDATLNEIQNGTGVFNNADLIYISHFHAGHLDVDRTINCIKANPNAILITTNDAKTSISNGANDFSTFEERIYVPELGNKESLDTIFNGIPVTLTKVAHENPQPATELLHIFFTIDGLNVAFYLEYHDDDVTELPTKTKDIDLCFLDGKSFIYDSFRSMLADNFEVGYTVLTHSISMSTMQQSIDENKDILPSVGILRNSMEKYSLTYSNSMATIDTLNQAPFVIEEVKNDTINVNETLNYKLPENIFSDLDNDKLNISVVRSNGNELPDWISYDENTMSLTGTPNDAQKLGIKIIATDPSNAYATTSFRIVVNDLTHIYEIDKKTKLKLFPNPGNGIVNLDLSNINLSNSKLCIYNSLGKQVCAKSIGEENCIIDIQNLEKGIYYFSIKSDQEITTTPYIKK